MNMCQYDLVRFLIISYIGIYFIGNGDYNSTVNFTYCNHLSSIIVYMIALCIGITIQSSLKGAVKGSNNI